LDESAKVKDEVEALGIVAPLLSDEGTFGADNTGLDPLDGTAAAHPGSQGKQCRSTTGTRPGVEDENRGFPRAVGTYTCRRFRRSNGAVLLHRVGIA